MTQPSLDRETFELLWSDLSGGRTLGSFVGSGIVPGVGEGISLVNPADGRPMGEYQDAGADVAELAMARAVEAQRVWSSLSGAARGRHLVEVARRLRALGEPIARLEAVAAGKPLRDTTIEVEKVAEMFEYYAGWCDKLHGAVIPVPTGHLNYTRREPLGVVLQITPANAPLFTAGWQVAPAIAAGNASVLKPSERAPWSSVVLARLILESGVPEGLVSVLAGLGPTSASAAIEHPSCSKVVFVGSLAVGREVAALCARRPIPCVLELGGKSANIVFADADLDSAIDGALAAGFAAAGQSCVAGSRLLVEARLYERFIEALAAGAAQIPVGHPLDMRVRLGPLGNEAQYQRVQAMLERSSEGHRVLRESASLPDEGYYVAPTIVADVRGDEPVAHDEVFGPIVAAISFNDEREAVELANDTPFGLAGAVWTKDGARAHRVAAAVRAGTFWVNGYKSIHVSSPFGGFGESGYGRSSGFEAMLEYSQTKSVWVTTDPP